MKEYGELGVSDDKESIFSTLKSRNSCLNPVGHERKKRSSKTRTIFIFEDTICPCLNIRISWFMRTISVYSLQTSASTVHSLPFGLIAEYPNKLPYKRWLANPTICSPYIIYVLAIRVRTLCIRNRRSVSHVRGLASVRAVLGMLATLARKSYVRLSLHYPHTTCNRWECWHWLENHMFTPSTLVGNVVKRTPHLRHP